MSRSSLAALCAMCCVVAGFHGCGGETGPAVYPVTGTVLQDGNPVEGAVVAFHSENATQLATGTTDAEGRFELTTNKPGDGTVPGKHKVTVTKIGKTEGGDAGSASMEEALESTEEPVQAQNELPKKYADPEMSQLEFTVTEAGPNDFKIELTN